MQYDIPMDLQSLIRQKRGGQELASDQIAQLTTALMAGDVPDYQLSALLMAICYEGLSFNETLALTKAYVDSGTQLEWTGLAGPVVDKHSTGGVGDKVSLLLAPWLACLGMYVPKMSGRGLGHTGGTIDKLESIPGFRVELDGAEMQRVLAATGCVVVSQSANLVPADKKTYAMRDATDTVDELGLIAASVLSKKIAAGADHIVLDVKCGSGAFFKTADRAREFARTAIRLGREFDRQVACVISSMDRPLGHAIGNALEVREVLDLLSGRRRVPDLQALCLALGQSLLLQTGRITLEQMDHGAVLLREQLDSGAVYRKFQEWVAAQGGNLAAFEAIAELQRCIDLTADTDCYIGKMDTLAIGQLACSLGAGRRTAADVINKQVGIICHRKTGDSLVAGAPLARIVASPADPRSDTDLKKAFLTALTFTHEPPPEFNIVQGVIGADWEY